MSLEQNLFGVAFQNPVLLAAGTCGFGREVAGVVDLEGLGGLVTKSVTLEPRWGSPPPRVAEVGPGMINAVGLANPGAEAVRREALPWLAKNLRRARVFVSVAGHTVEEYLRVVELLDGAEGFLGFELNLSCPNDDRLEGRPFALVPETAARVVQGVRERTERPLVAKLAPHDPDPGATVRAVEEAGADGATLVNTLPGLAYAPRGDRPLLGAGGGGVSGPGLRPVGVRAVREARDASPLPLIGVGGVGNGEDALQYLRAGASLIQVGTASFADPRAALGVVRDLEAWARRGDAPRSWKRVRGRDRGSGPEAGGARGPNRGAENEAPTAPVGG